MRFPGVASCEFNPLIPLVLFCPKIRALSVRFPEVRGLLIRPPTPSPAKTTGAIPSAAGRTGKLYTRRLRTFRWETARVHRSEVPFCRGATRQVKIGRGSRCAAGDKCIRVAENRKTPQPLSCMPPAVRIGGACVYIRQDGDDKPAT